MAGGGPGPATPINIFEARLKTDLEGVSATLTLLPYKGNRIEINRRLVLLGVGGLTRDVADNLITVTGADSGAAGAVSTLYYVYVANALATFSPSSIRLSATAPGLVNGVKYLGTTGNALNWRFVGWVQLNATPNFESSLLSRLIINYYNKIALALYANPGFVDDNATTSYTTSSATWIRVSAATGIGGVTTSTLSFISNGEDDVDYDATFFGFGANGGGVPVVAIGVDSITQAAVTGELAAAASSVSSSTMIGSKVTLAEGLHTLEMLIASIVANPSTFFADVGRFGGSAADEPATMMSATVMG